MESKNFTYKYLKFVSFSGLELWDTKRYNSKKVNSSFDLKQLYNCIIEQSTKYKIFEEKETEFKILGVNNKEGIFDAYILKGKDIKQPYKKMQSGWIAYNPYRINVGSIGIKLNEHKYEYISPAYVVFSCKENLLPEYLFMIFKTELFNNIIKESTTGSVRQNLTFDSLKKLQIPLPSLEEQNRLVENYAKKIKVAEKQEQEAVQLEHEIENYLLEELGVEKQMEEKKQPGKLIFVHFKDIKEWGIDKISNRTFNLFNSHYEIVSLSNSSNLYIDVFRGKSPKYSENSTKYILNQKCNRWNSIEIEHARKVDDSWINSVKDIFLTKEHDILINSTGEGTIGRASYINKNFSGLLYDSHILLLRLNNKLIDSLYFIYFFNSLLGQEQVNEIKSAQSTKQTELGINNLLKINFPLPPLEKQKEIVAYITNLKNKIKKLHILAKKNREEAIQEFEQEIFYS